MKYKVVILLLCCILILSGCHKNNNSEYDNNTFLENNNQSELVDNNSDNNNIPSNILDDSDNYFYQLPVDPSVWDKAKPEEKLELRDPYVYSGGKIINNNIVEDVKETDSQGNNEDVNNTDIEENNNNEENSTDITSTPEKSAEDIEYEHQKLAYEINKKVYNDIYTSGIVIVGTYFTESKNKDYNSYHKITIEESLNTLKSNLEWIEYLDGKILLEFSNNEKLVRAWGNLYKQLIEYRNIINEIDKASDLNDKEQEIKAINITSDISTFRSEIMLEIKDYDPLTIRLPTRSTKEGGSNEQ